MKNFSVAVLTLRAQAVRKPDVDTLAWQVFTTIRSILGSSCCTVRELRYEDYAHCPAAALAPGMHYLQAPTLL